MESKIEETLNKRTKSIEEIKILIDNIKELLDHITKVIDGTRDDVSDGDK